VSSTERDNLGTRIPQELVDRFFDRELDEGSREKFFGMLRADLSRCAEVAKTQRMISMLREPVATPDLTERIMTRVHGRRAFLPQRMRNMVKAGRLAAAAVVLLALFGVALAERMRPGTMRLVDEPQPLTELIESGRSDAAAGAQQLAAAVRFRPSDAAPDVKAGTGAAVAVGPVIATSPKRVGVGSLTPGVTTAWTLPKAAGSGLAVLPGAGSEVRFVLVDGLCIDRKTQTVVAFGYAIPGAEPEACAEPANPYVLHVMELAGLKRPGAMGSSGGTGGGPGGGAGGGAGSGSTATGTERR
jgi:hypothetical protein